MDKKIKVLIVDDEVLVRIGIIHALDWETHGFVIVGEAVDGASCLKMTERLEPDLILLDINMPGQNGLQVLQELRENGYQGKVIMLTCYDEFEYVRSALRGGADDYVLKSSMNESGLLDAVLHLDYHSQKQKNKTDAIVKQEQYLLQQIAEVSFGETCDLSFDNSCFCCIVNKIIDIEKAEMRYRQKGMDFFNRSLFSVLEQALHGDQESCILWYDKETIGIFVSFSRIASLQEKLIRIRKLMVHIHEVIGNYFDLQLLSGVSGFCYGAGEIKKAWEQAVMILDRGFSNRGLIFYYNDYRDYYERQSQIYMELVDVEIRIKKLTIEGGVEELKEGLQEYFEFIRTSRIVSASRIREFCIDFLNLVYAKKKEWKESDILKQIHQQETLEELETYVYRLLAHIFPDCTDQNAGWLVQRACEYIKKQYQQDIGLCEIARYLQLSESYTSRIFNREMGMNIPAYIKQIRIERAKQLLLHTNKKIYEIAEETGYLSTTAFHIAFKKQTGITPMDYRNHGKNYE